MILFLSNKVCADASARDLLVVVDLEAYVNFWRILSLKETDGKEKSYY